MTTVEKVALTQVIVDNDNTATAAVVTAYLSMAKNVILRCRYPFGVPEDAPEVPEEYEVLQCQLAARYFLRRGAEGETSHNENGVSRTYGSAEDVDLLNLITPTIKVVS